MFVMAIEHYSNSIKLFKNYMDFAKSMKVDEHLMLHSGVDIAVYNAIQDEVILSFEALANDKG
jgi:hypothetical protein